jgi:hypothetical protein
MRSDVCNGPCIVEVHGSGVFVKWYEKWTGPETGPLSEGSTLKVDPSEKWYALSTAHTKPTVQAKDQHMLRISYLER